jgi:phenylacetate-coenzyme A ligase PaaK-like adenylate-forming protein
LARRAQAVGDLRAHAVARSAFYREHHRGLEGAPLHELPVVTKAELLARYDDVVTDPALRLADLEAFVRTQRVDQRHLDRYWVAGTGGTTGRPALFAYDLEEWVAMMARAGRARALAGPPPKARRGRTRYAKVASSLPTHMSRQAGSGLRNPLAPVLRLGATDPLERAVAALDDWQPHGLTAFPSMLRALADEQLAGRLHIAPTRVHASAEALTDETRRKIRQAWGTEPFDTYVSTEGGTLAAECTAHAGLHLLDDDVIVEVVDDQRRPVGPGGTGSAVLLTVLTGRTPPLIRYEVTDALRLGDGPCPCGRPGTMVAAIEGRVEEVGTSQQSSVRAAPRRAGSRAASDPILSRRRTGGGTMTDRWGGRGG